MSAPNRVGVLFGGPSPEHDVSILTGLLSMRALRAHQRGYGVQGIFWSKNGSFHGVDDDLEAVAFIDGAPSSSRPLELVLGPDGGFFASRGRLSRPQRLEFDALIICCHGGPGEDGALQGALDLAGISYSGPSAIAAALGMDKLATAALVARAGLPVLARALLGADLTEFEGSGPFIVKPRFGGSSIGIDVVADLDTARARLAANQHLRRGAVIEPFRPDLFDLQIAVRSYPAIELSAIERPLRSAASSEILGYADKYVGGEGMHAASRELPAQIDDDLERRLRDAARTVALVLGVRGVCRVDFLSDGNELFVNEVNTIPGSLSRHLFIDPPLSFESLLDGLLEEAVNRPAASISSVGADGAVLREAKSIAGKLA